MKFKEKIHKMKKTRKIKKKIVPLVLAFSFSLASNVYASDFTDVTNEHWAYEAIVSVTDRGIMNPNAAGAFRPNSPVDKFETSRILALAAGFNEASTDFINEAVSNHQTALNSVSNRFSRWNSAVNREVAFLMELGVLTNTDINNFIVMSNNAEELRALSRQEAAVFLVRAANLSAEIGREPVAPFTDNNQIAVASRPYIDLLRINGIISGDGYGNFVPNAAVNRAAMALMIYRTLNLQSELGFYWSHQIEVEVPTPPVQVPPPIPVPPPSTPAPPNPVPPPSLPPTQVTPEELPTIPNVSTRLTGVVYKIDAETNFLAATIRFLTPAGVEHSSILGLRLAASFEITKNNEDIPLSDLNIGDAVNLTIVDGRITEIIATERNRSFTATLVATHNSAIIVNYNSEMHEVGIGQNTNFERQGQGTVPLSAFRIGDEIDIIIENNIATNLFAFGTRSTVDGTIRSLNMVNDIITIVLETSSGERTLYRRGTLPGVYVGSRVRFQLDSSEVLSFSVLN